MKILKNLALVLCLIALTGLIACSDTPMSPNNENNGDKNPPQFHALKVEHFWATPKSVPTGGSVTLSWLVKHATLVTVEPWPGVVSTGDTLTAGGGVLTINSTTVFVLTARGKTMAGTDTVVVLRDTVMVKTPEPKQFSILITPNGVSGNGVTYVGFDQYEHVDDVSLLRTWTVWPNGDSVRIERNGKVVAGSSTALNIVAIQTDTIPKWYQSWETPESDFGMKGNFQASFRLRPTYFDVTLGPNEPFFMGDTLAPAFGKSDWGKEEKHPVTLTVWSDDWDVLRCDLGGDILFGKKGAPNILRIHVSPAPDGFHESWRKSVADAQRDGNFQVSWWKD